MSRTFHRHIWIALFNKKKANAMAKIKEKLKAESQARAKAEKRLRAEIESRASAEQKVKAEAEKMLLTQHRRYSVLAERAEAQAKEAIAAAEAKAEEKIRSYAAALAQTEEKLTKAEENAKTKAITRAKAAEESLLASAKAEAAAGKAESEERQRVEAKAKEAIAAAEAKAEEKIRSYAAALAQAEEKLTKAKEKARTDALTRAKAEESLLASAKAEAAAGKAKSKERQSLDAQPAETIKTFKRIRRHVFHPGAIKRKFTLFSALAILSAIALTFGVSVANDPPVAEPGSATTQEETPVPITLMGSAPDGEQLTYNVITGPSHGSLSGTAPSMTYTPALNYNGPDNFTFSVNDGKADSDQVMISIVVLAVNDAPVANPQSETTKVNKSVSAALTGSDVDGEPLMFIICKKPEHGTLTFDSNFNTNGRFIYTPEPYFAGPDIFTFKLNDGKVDSAPATVSINVAPNHLPVAEPHSVTTTEDTPVAISLMGSDPDSDPLAYNTVTRPSHGSLNGTAPNLTYTPNTNFYRSDSFTFKVNDGTADSIPATVSITVNPAPPKIAKLTVLDGYNQRNRKTLSADGKTNLVQSSDNGRWETSFGSYVSFDFSDVSIPADAAIKSVVVRVEHFEEERFTKGKLKWSIGTGWPLRFAQGKLTKPVVWATLNAPVHEEEHHEAVDSWDVTGVVDTLENINSLQLQVKNNDNVAHRKTLIDYIYVLVEWD